MTEPPPRCAGPSPGAFPPGFSALLGHPRLGGRFSFGGSQCSRRGSGALARTVCFPESLNHLLKSGPTSRMEKVSRRDLGEEGGEDCLGAENSTLGGEFLTTPHS